MKTKSLLSKILCVLMLSTGYALSACTEGPIDNGDGNEQEGMEEKDMGTAIYRIEGLTATTASFTGKLKVTDDELQSDSQVTVYYTSDDVFDLDKAKSVSTSSFGPDQDFKIVLFKLRLNTKYKYCILTDLNSEKTYSEVGEFSTAKVTCEVEVSAVTGFTVTFTGKVSALSDEDRSSLSFGIVYNTDKEMLIQGKGKNLVVSEIASDGSFSVQATGLDLETKYYFSSYISDGEYAYYSSPQEFTTLSPYNNNLDVSSASDLGSPANCYIISEAGLYKFQTVQGNSTESVGTVASAEVLWETFGTDVAPDFGDLISGVCYKNGYIAFQTASAFREGNAVIAAKDADGTILWSWHIWMTDEPQEQVYANDAGVLMDRNLGASSVTPGDICTYGLLYQWGRKDPFLNAAYINDRMIPAKSTITWPDIVESDSSIGTIAYATSHPTTFIDDCFNNRDWYYSSTTGTDNTRWQKSKTIYDPCPAGWRVPNGAKTGVWCTAFNTTQDWTASSGYDAENRGIDFSRTSKVLGSSGPIWYPFAGQRTETHGILWDTGNVGFYWSVNTYEEYAYSMTISGYTEGVEPWSLDHRAYGMSVRCMKE